MGDLGIQMASLRGFSDGKINAALAASSRADTKYIAADLAKLILECGFGIREEVRLGGLTIRDLEIGGTEADVGKLHFHDCFFLASGSRFKCGW